MLHVYLIWPGVLGNGLLQNLSVIPVFPPRQNLLNTIIIMKKFVEINYVSRFEGQEVCVHDHKRPYGEDYRVQSNTRHFIEDFPPWKRVASGLRIGRVPDWG